MNELANSKKAGRFSVVDNYDYSTQSESYNRDFIKWRKKKDNLFAFGFEVNKDESVYVDGRGFVVKSASDAEIEVLVRVFYILGLALIAYVVLDTLFRKGLIILLSYLNIDIHANFFSDSLYGGSKEIVAVLIVTALLKVLIPAAYLQKRFGLPRNVEFMRSMHDPAGLVGAIAATFIVCVGSSLPNAYSSEPTEIYTYFKNLNADVEVWGQFEYLLYTLFDIIIMSIFTELFFRGAMFAVMRQFGDAFAVIMTSLTTAMLTMDLREAPIMFVISLIASVGMLYSGSIFTAIAVNIVFKMYQLALIVIQADHAVRMPLTRNMFMIIVLVSGAVMLLIVWLLHKYRGNKKILVSYSSDMNLLQRMVYSVKIFPYSAVAVICFVYAIVKLVL